MNKLTAQNQKLQQKCKQLQNKILKFEQQAKNNLKKSKQTKGSTSQVYKNKCLMALKNKKQVQAQLKGIMSRQNMLNNVQMTHQTVKNHKQMLQTMQHAITQQKQIMTQVDYDKLQNLQDQMMNMKFQTDYMNQMLNRNYDVDLDQDELDQDFLEFQKQIAKEKKKNVVINNNKAPEKNVNNNNVNKVVNNNNKPGLYDDNFDINKF